MDYGNAVLPNYPPHTAVNIINDRLSEAKQVNEAIAEWIRQRAQIEEDYSIALDKLARKKLSVPAKTFSHGSSAKPIEDSLGGLSGPWNELVTVVRDNARASGTLARRMRNDVGAPISQYSSKSSPWQDLSSMHEGLTLIADKLSFSEADYTKAKTKQKSESKQESAALNLAEVRSQWENQAPFAFGQLQKVDESRLVFLKDALTRLETLQLDYSQSSIANSEKVLNSLLSFEPIEDLSSFTALASSGHYSESLPEPHASRETPAHASQNDHRRTAPRIASFASQRSHGSDEPSALGHQSRSSTARSAFSDDVSSINSGSTGNANSGDKSLSGLHLRSRVGSIFRNKNKKSQSSFRPTTDSIPEDSNGSSGHKVPPPAAPVPRQSRQSAESHRPNTNGSTTSSSVATSAPSAPLSAAVGAVPKPAPPPSRRANGPSSPTAMRSSSEEENLANDARNQPTSGLKVNIQDGSVPQRREEADDDDVALSTLATTLRAKPTISGRGNRGRRDIQSRYFANLDEGDVAPSPPEKDGNFNTNYPTGDTSAAFGTTSTAPTGAATNPLMSQLQDFSLNKSVNSGSGGDSRASVISPGATYHDSKALSPPPSLKPAATGLSLSDAHSIRSATSVSTTDSSRHPELLQIPGLSATILELITTTVKDGYITDASVSGEVAVGYNGDHIPNGYGLLRFVNAGLDKIVPNTSFVSQVGLEGFASGATTPGGGLFKVNFDPLYNLKHGAVALRYSAPYGGVPVIFTPIWRVEPQQSSLMLTYKLSDEVASVIDHIVLQDLSITVPVKGGSAVSAQSKPTSIFNRESQKVVWKSSGPVTVRRGSEERFLCRFTTSNGPCFEADQGIDVKFKVFPAPTFQLEFQQPPLEGPGDPFKDDPTKSVENLLAQNNWVPLPSLGTLAIAKYLAKSENNVQKRLD